MNCLHVSVVMSGVIQCLLQSILVNGSGNEDLCVDEYRMEKIDRESLLAVDSYSLLGCAISTLPRAVAQIKDQWMQNHIPINLDLRNSSSNVFRQWVRALYFAVRQAGGKITSCILVMPDTGQGLGVGASDCHDVRRGTLTLISGLHLDPQNKMVQATYLHGTHDCDPANTSDGSYCSRDSIDYDWNQSFVVAPHYDFRLADWYGDQLEIANGTDYIAYTPRFISVQGNVAFGAGMVLYDKHTRQRKGVVQCALQHNALSTYFGRIADPFERIFTFHKSGGLLTASSHTNVTSQTSPLNCGDPVIERITWFLLHLFALKNFSFSDFPFTETFRWTSRSAFIKFYVLYYDRLDWVMVVSLTPVCFPGRQLSMEDLDKYGYNCSNEAQKCPPGTFADGILFGEHCKKCPVGTYQSRSESTMCATCESGTYQAQKGQTACIYCPDNTESWPGAKNVTQCFCKSGHYALDKGVACSKCPTGAKCNGKHALPYAKEKYFAVAGSTGEYFRCVSLYEGNSCLGGNASEVNACKDGYTGAACLLCASGYYRLGKVCRQCGAENTVSMLWLWFWLLVLLFYLLRRVVNTHYKSLYVFLSFLQVFGLQSSFRVAWTSDIKIILRYIQVTNLQVDFLIPSCEQEMTFPYKFLIYMLLPWFFLIVDLALLFRKNIRSHLCPKESLPDGMESLPDGITEEHSRTFSGTLQQRFAGMYHTATHLHFEVYRLARRPPEKYWGDFSAMFVVNMRLMYLSICGHTFDMLTCTPLADGTSRLSKDPNVECWTGLHLKFMPLVVISLVFYVIGTPLIYLLVLVSGKRRKTLYTTDHLGRWRTLYSRFKHDSFFWELIIVFRRLCVVSIKTFLNTRLAVYQQTGYIGNFQAGLTCTVMFVAGLLHTGFCPFVDPWLNVGDCVYLSCTFFSVLLGVCFSAAQTDGETYFLENLFHLNLLLVLVVTCILLYRDLEHNCRRVVKLRRRIMKSLSDVFGVRLPGRDPKVLATQESNVEHRSEEPPKDNTTSLTHQDARRVDNGDNEEPRANGELTVNAETPEPASPLSTDLPQETYQETTL